MSVSGKQIPYDGFEEMRRFSKEFGSAPSVQPFQEETLSALLCSPNMNTAGDPLTAQKFITRIVFTNQSDVQELRVRLGAAAENLAANFSRNIDWFKRIWVCTVFTFDSTASQRSNGSLNVSLTCRDITKAVSPNSLERFNNILDFSGRRNFAEDPYQLDANCATSFVPYGSLPRQIMEMTFPPITAASVSSLLDPAIVTDTTEIRTNSLHFKSTLISRKEIHRGQSLAETRLSEVRKFIALNVVSSVAFFLSHKIDSVSFIVGLQDFTVPISGVGQLKCLYGLVSACIPTGNVYSVCAELIPRGSALLQLPLVELESSAKGILTTLLLQGSPVIEKIPPRPPAKKFTIADILKDLGED